MVCETPMNISTISTRIVASRMPKPMPYTRWKNLGNVTPKAPKTKVMAAVAIKAVLMVGRS